MEGHRPLSEEEQQVSAGIVDAALKVHRALGPGLLEKVYEACLCHELAKRGFEVKRQVAVPVHYEDLVFEEGMRLDVIVEDLVICELKAADHEHPVWHAQILSYLRLMNKRLGLLINFNVPLIRDGIKRIIL